MHRAPCVRWHGGKVWAATVGLTQTVADPIRALRGHQRNQAADRWHHMDSPRQAYPAGADACPEARALLT